jgi:hypothetical protein
VDRESTGGITITALVQPAADLDSLELVLVITDFRPDPLPGATPTPAPTPTAERSGDPDDPEATRRPRRTPRPTRRN